MATGDYRVLSQMDWESAPFPIVEQEFRIVVTEAVFDQINAMSNTTHEVGGILVGEVYHDDSGPFLMVDAVIDALHAREGETELTITYATWEHVHHEMDSLYVGKRIVGWYHTHPGFGIFLSEQDQFIHKNFFDQPYQIALVYDPVKREHGAFVWRDNKIWRMRRYWVGDSEHAWDGPREMKHEEQPEAIAGAKAGPKPDPTLSAPSAPPGAQPGSQPAMAIEWTSQPILLGIIVIALILGGLVGLEVGQSRAMVAARTQGAQEAVASLNADILNILNETLGDESLDANLDTLEDRLRAIKERLAQTDDMPPQAVNALNEALADLEASRDERRTAQVMLQRLEEVVLNTSDNLQTIQTNLAVHQSVLGQLYLESANLTLRVEGDNGRERALNLLSQAEQVDPKNKAFYAEQKARISPAEEKQDFWWWLGKE